MHAFGSSLKSSAECSFTAEEDEPVFFRLDSAAAVLGQTRFKSLMSQKAFAPLLPLATRGTLTAPTFLQGTCSGLAFQTYCLRTSKLCHTTLTENRQAASHIPNWKQAGFVAYPKLRTSKPCKPCRLALTENKKASAHNPC